MSQSDNFKMDLSGQYRLEDFFGRKRIREQKYDNDQLTRVLQACTILKALGLDRRHYYSTGETDRSPWVLLALAGISRNTYWKEATNSQIGIDAIINFIEKNYNFKYKTGSREGIRKECLHLFLYRRLVNVNEDTPHRATNSKDYNYSLTPEFLKVLKSFEEDSWEGELNSFASSLGELEKKWQEKVIKSKIKVSISPTHSILLSPGEHNQLQSDIVHKFCPRFIKNDFSVIYLGDADKARNSGGKLLHMDSKAFDDLNIKVLDKGKLPDVMVYDQKNNWLFLIEAVTSRGEFSATRHDQLTKLVTKCKAGIVFVTAFPTRKLLRKFVADIAWETEVWIAENPDHMIHFNGDRFLGPHDTFS
ncbi:BsuBI/PstI family type II restriction endonuclease [Pseudomonas sp. A-B-19]|uniref:BsuBI/PstI family type II restriction endonuclease n=1 Tax=Pseudomonas sp. A-B-19 TaxID=2832405 RepID=UPI001CC0F433|nr:BsuBI/PstI family type II restriction endonuclease [Pseudomonas sp. A-B-19]